MEKSQEFLCIIDDDPDTCQLLSELVESNLYDMKLFTCPRKALDFLKDKKPFAVILDYYMPIMDGHAFCLELQKIGLHKNVVIMVSSWPPDGGRIPEDIQDNVRFFLEKPDALERLPMVVSKLFDESLESSL